MSEVVTTLSESTGSQADQVEKYSNMINTYGVGTVIIAVFIVLLFLAFIYIIRSNQKTRDELMSQQQKLIDSVLKRMDTIEEEQKQGDKKPNLVDTFAKINNGIKEVLKDIYEETDADRISTYVFHNGVHSSHGLPFFKVSCICEVIKKHSGVSKTAEQQNALPLQIFDSAIDHIIKDGQILVSDISTDLEDDLILSNMIKSNNIKSAMCIAIYDDDNNIVGILLAEFVDIHDKEFLLSVKDTLLDQARILSPILSYSDIYNNNDN